MLKCIYTCQDPDSRPVYQHFLVIVLFPQPLSCIHHRLLKLCTRNKRSKRLSITITKVHVVIIVIVAAVDAVIGYGTG